MLWSMRLAFLKTSAPVTTASWIDHFHSYRRHPAVAIIAVVGLPLVTSSTFLQGSRLSINRCCFSGARLHHPNLPNSNQMMMTTTTTNTPDNSDLPSTTTTTATTTTQQQQPQQQRRRWGVCPVCHGEGKLLRPPSRKARIRHQKKIKMNNNNNNSSSSRHEDDDEYKNNNPVTAVAAAAAAAQPRIETCAQCTGSGLIAVDCIKVPSSPSQSLPTTATTASSSISSFPGNIAIIGGGLGGLALALACRHRGIACTVYERDSHFHQRSQGYGLTLQQASRAVAGFGLSCSSSASSGTDDHHSMATITSTRHVVHTTDGTIVGEWGLRKWGRRQLRHSNNQPQQQQPKRMNFHIPRQELRYALYQALLREEKWDDSASSSASSLFQNKSIVQWNHQLIDYTVERDHIQLRFNVQKTDGGSNNNNNNNIIEQRASLVVGADGIRSTVRKIHIGDEATPLRYLNCLVVLGICPLESVVSSLSSPSSLLDGATVFQTADGTTRWYAMPYSASQCMWQLSFPMINELEAQELSRQGPVGLQQEAKRRCGLWHDPIPQLIDHTPVELITGYPCYDRELLTRDVLSSQPPRKNDHHDPLGFCRRVTLLGDAAHPMSPFKGQGANQALLDALSLARAIYKAFCNKTTNEDCTTGNSDETDNEDDIAAAADNDETRCLEQALNWYEEDMLSRSAVKVQASADAAHFLHTDVAIRKGDVTRGGAARRAHSPMDNQGGGDGSSDDDSE